MIIEEVMLQRMQGVKNEKGRPDHTGVPEAYLCVDEDNITEGSKYWHLTELVAKCTAKRMVPDYISAKIMKELKKGEVYPCMGCRSFLTVEDSQMLPNGRHKFYGRFNQGVVTINLVEWLVLRREIWTVSGRFSMRDWNCAIVRSAAVMRGCSARSPMWRRFCGRMVRLPA